MSPYGTALVAQLREAIVRTGWSETARRAGVNRCALHRSFKRGGTPSFERIDAVAEAVGMRVSLTRGDFG